MDKITTTAYWSSFTAWIGGMSSNDVAAYGGLLVAVATYGTNLYFKIRADKRAQQKGAN